MPGDAKLAHDEDVQGHTKSRGNLGGDGNPTSGQAEDEEAGLGPDLGRNRIAQHAARRPAVCIRLHELGIPAGNRARVNPGNRRSVADLQDELRRGARSASLRRA